jgi:hypothetical protein
MRQMLAEVGKICEGLEACRKMAGFGEGLLIGTRNLGFVVVPVRV